MGINYEELWTEFKQWIVNYNMLHKPRIDEVPGTDGRYCVAISCDDLVEKMTEMEKRH